MIRIQVHCAQIYKNYKKHSEWRKTGSCQKQPPWLFGAFDDAASRIVQVLDYCLPLNIKPMLLAFSTFLSVFPSYSFFVWGID